MPQIYDGTGKYTTCISDRDIIHIAEKAVEVVVNSLNETARTSNMVKYVLKTAEDMAGSLPVTCASHPNPEEHTERKETT